MASPVDVRGRRLGDGPAARSPARRLAKRRRRRLARRVRGRDRWRSLADVGRVGGRARTRRAREGGRRDRRRRFDSWLRQTVKIPHHHQRQNPEASSRSAASTLDGGSDSRGEGQSSEKNLGRTNGGVPAAVVPTAAAAEAASTAAAWLARRSASERSVPASFCCPVRGQPLEEEATGLGWEGREGRTTLCVVSMRARWSEKGEGEVRYFGSPGLRQIGEGSSSPV